jgi:hypothetical protein
MDLPEHSRNTIITAIRFFEDAFKSNFFRESILSFNFNKKYNLGLTNEQIYYRLMLASEINGNVAYNTADLFLEMLFEPGDGRTIGFVRSNTNIICTYYQFLASLDIAKLTGHFAHEWTHLLGFGHPIDTGLNLAYLKKTVPYAVMDIVEAYVNQRKIDLLLV